MLMKLSQVKQFAPNHTAEPRCKPRTVDSKTHFSESSLFLSLLPASSLGLVDPRESLRVLSMGGGGKLAAAGPR